MPVKIRIPSPLRNFTNGLDIIEVSAGNVANVLDQLKDKAKGIETRLFKGPNQLNRYVNIFSNYSYQWKPVAEGLPPGTSINDINWPAKNRFNAGFDFNYSHFLGNLSVNFTDDAYWQDVLDIRYAGTTNDFTLVNGTFGVRWLGDRITTSVKVVNLGNQQVQQHIFGDIIRRQIVGEARVTF